MSDNQMIPAVAETAAKADETDRKYEKTGFLNVFGDEKDFVAAQRMAVPLSKSDCVPDQYKNNPANCMIAIDIASRMGLSPLTVMQNLYIVKGKPSWSGQACRALIENNGRFKDLRPVYVGRQGEDDWGCYYEATDTITGETVRGTKVDILMAKKEGWYSKKDRNGNETSKWQTMPELMLAYRAAAFFARVHCPSAMMGFQTVEEVNDVANAERKHRIDSITSDILGG